MKISKTHEEFADRLNFWYTVPKQDVLNHPEKYLGPNWEEVINFWLYLDTLSEEQMKVVEKHYYALNYEERKIARGRSRNVASATIKYGQDASNSAYYSVSYAKSAAYYATEEFIGLDKLLEQGHQPVFFPMFLDL
jgi:hypothetical protein